MAGRGIDRVLERRIAALIASRERAALTGGRRGVEREALRVSTAGRISARPHPVALGSALAHPHITTDFSESLIELVTPTFNDNSALQQYLSDLHQFVHQRLDGELLWAPSMPAPLTGDADLPIAHYGASHRGRFKEVYRRGLLTRYGGMMQAIAGIHFNYSFPDKFWPLWAEIERARESGAALRSEAYMALVRNFRRYGWLVSYLFGSSPAMCRSFLQGRSAPDLKAHADGTLIAEYATSLRMSDLGYRNRSQTAVYVSANSLDAYLLDLVSAVLTVNPAFESLGVKVDGEYRQLNAGVLQISNEYYTYIRPKRVPRADENMCQALNRAGVEYVEVRSLDCNSLEPTGTEVATLCFLEAMLALFLFKDSPPIGAAEQEEFDHNHVLVARRGREPRLALRRDGRDVPLSDWLAELLDSMQGLCEVLDEGQPHAPYEFSLQLQEAKLRDPQLTPAARQLREMRERREGFVARALRLSAQHQEQLLNHHQASAGTAAALAEETAASVIEQSRIEKNDRGSFDEYIWQQMDKYRTLRLAGR